MSHITRKITNQYPIAQFTDPNVRESTENDVRGDHEEVGRCNVVQVEDNYDDEESDE